MQGRTVLSDWEAIQYIVCMKAPLLICLTALFAISLNSCSQEKIEEKENGMISELARMGHIVTVEKSGYTRVEAVSLERAHPDAPYSSGVIEYHEDGQVMASVDFSEGEIGEAKVKDKEGEQVKELEKEDKDGKEESYLKVITEPLVKSEDCQYIVAGEIKFFDKKGWVATFDYGDGTCDDLVKKTTADDINTFSLDDYPEYNSN